MIATLHSEVSGRGPPLALLHGWGMNLRVFDSLRERLAAHFTVTAVDLPGHGRSRWNAPSHDAQQAALAAVIAPGSVIAGWSLGGQIALQLAADKTLHRQLQPRALVLLSTTPRFVSGADWPHGLDAAILQGFAAHLVADPHGTVADFLALQVRAVAGAEPLLQTLQRALRAGGEASTPALRAGLEQLLQNDLRTVASTIELPTLVIAGARDRITPLAAGRALAELMPQAQLLELPRAGHAPFLSHLEAVLAATLSLAASRSAA